MSQLRPTITLFLIRFYINDLPDIVQNPLSVINLVADDYTLYHVISTSGILQDSMNSGQPTTTSFNKSKCKYMIVSRKRDPPLYQRVIYNFLDLECWDISIYYRCVSHKWFVMVILLEVFSFAQKHVEFLVCFTEGSIVWYPNIRWNTYH